MLNQEQKRCIENTMDKAFEKLREYNNEKAEDWGSQELDDVLDCMRIIHKANELTK